MGNVESLHSLLFVAAAEDVGVQEELLVVLADVSA